MSGKILRVLNNNVILIKGKQGKQYILVGKGIGFNKHIGDRFVITKQVEQTFILQDNNNQKNYENLVNKTDSQLTTIAEEELAIFQKEIPQTLNENIHSTLIDHLRGAIDRYRKGIIFENPYNYVIQATFESEYEAARRIVNRLNKKYGVEMNENEISIVAMHLNAAKNNVGIAESMERTELANKTVEEIYKNLNMEIDYNSFIYKRMVIHCVLAYNRIFNRTTIDNDLTNNIRKLFPKEFKC